MVSRLRGLHGFWALNFGLLLGSGFAFRWLVWLL